MLDLSIERSLQQKMHKDFFYRCKNAIDNGCYFEAILMEYAAIEGRLEIIMGVIGLPCNIQLLPKEKQEINISKRIECLRRAYRDSNVLKNTLITNSFWKELGAWISTRNMYIHGLYKNVFQYKTRMKDVEELATKGYEYNKLLYKEAKRVRRLLHNNVFSDTNQIHCGRSVCSYIAKNPSKRS